MKNINHKAPVKSTNKVIIYANSVDVWKVITNIDQWTLWNGEIKKSVLNGSLKEGSTFDWKSGGINIHSTLHTVEAFSSFGWTGKSMGLFAIHNWQIIELSKQTEVIVEESMEGALAWLFRKVLNKSVRKKNEKWLMALKNKCES